MREEWKWTYACQLEDFGSQVFKDSSDVNGSFGANSHLVLGVGLKETLDTTARELKSDVLLAMVMRASDESRWLGKLHSVHATGRISNNRSNPSRIWSKVVGLDCCRYSIFVNDVRNVILSSVWLRRDVFVVVSWWWLRRWCTSREAG